MSVYASMDWVDTYMTYLESHNDTYLAYIARVLDVVVHTRYQMEQEVTVL